MEVILEVFSAVMTGIICNNKLGNLTEQYFRMARMRLTKAMKKDPLATVPRWNRIKFWKLLATGNDNLALFLELYIKILGN